MDNTLADQLTEALGAKAIDATRSVILPTSRDGLVAAIRVLAAGKHPLAVTSAAPAGRPSDDSVTLISLSQLAAVDVDVAAMVVRAEAGATVEAVRGAAHRQGLAVPGLPAGDTVEHVGGVIMRGQVPRRSLSGIEIVLPTGERISQGGRVLKDVSSFDVATLMLGSMGRYALVLAVTLRLQPEAAVVPIGAARGEISSLALPDLPRAFDPNGLLRRLK